MYIYFVPALLSFCCMYNICNLCCALSKLFECVCSYMATTHNHDCSTRPSINRNCLAEECESSGECSNDISFTEDWGESSRYLSPNSYRQMLSLCDIASGMSHHSPLTLRVQTLRIISQCVYDHGMSREPIDVCQEPGALISSTCISHHSFSQKLQITSAKLLFFTLRNILSHLYHV